MDGKKRIARLRNAERWKLKGVGWPFMRKQERLKKAEAAAFVVVDGGVKAREIAAFQFKMFKPKSEPLADTMHPFKDAHSYAKWLEKRGYEHLGSGCYSSVYAKPGSDRVIKVTRTLDNWVDYIQWAAKAGYAGNLAPKVYSWKRHGDWSAAVVERMEKGYHKADVASCDAALIMSLTWPAKKGNLLAQVYMEDIQPGSVQFFKELTEKNFDSDVGGNNVMFRKDGTICITDPTCARLESDVTRLRTGDLSPAPIKVYHGLQQHYYGHA